MILQKSLTNRHFDIIISPNVRRSYRTSYDGDNVAFIYILCKSLFFAIKIHKFKYVMIFNMG